MANETDAHAWGRRLSAAIAYAGLNVADFAKTLTEDEQKDYKLSPTTLYRMTKGAAAAGGKLQISFLAQRLGVPEWFLYEGFEGKTLADGDTLKPGPAWHPLIQRLEEVGKRIEEALGKQPAKPTRRRQRQAGSRPRSPRPGSSPGSDEGAGQ